MNRLLCLYHSNIAFWLLSGPKNVTFMVNNLQCQLYSEINQELCKGVERKRKGGQSKSNFFGQPLVAEKEFFFFLGN